MDVSARRLPPVSLEAGNGFDLVSVGVEDEPTVIRRPILRPQPRGTGILPAQSERLVVELVDGRLIAGFEGDVNAISRSCGSAIDGCLQAVTQSIIGPIIDRFLVSLPDAQPQNSHQRIVKSSCASQIGYAHGYMTDAGHEACSGRLLHLE